MLICINQSDVAERGSQVALMDKVYSTAQKVVIWLGEDNQHTELGMETIALIQRRILTETHSLPVDASDHEQYRAMADVFTEFLARPDSESWALGVVALYIRPWWRRVWTMQEVAPAQLAKAHCGCDHLAWEQFVLFSDYLTMLLIVEVFRRHIARTDTGRQALGGLPSIVVTARLVWNMRDRRNSGKINPSYMVLITFDRLVTDPRDKIYGLLALVNDGATLQPNYNRSVREVYIEGFKAMLQNANDAVLVLEGVPIDVLDFVGDPAPPVQDNKFRGLQSSVKDTIYRWKRLGLGLEGSPGAYVTGESTSSAFWRTIVIDQKLVDYHPNFRMMAKERDQIRLDVPDVAIPPATPEQEEHLIRVLDSPGASGGSMSHLSNRRFFRRQKGHIGLAYLAVQKGDIACVLLGGDVPYILRPLDNGRYSMLGGW
ncbi:uncharacterized protein A1O5_03025 [Cladophialophora psammophila CBS 110553]|uniref:Heterokaryon incompatibility domain-containing protein n=1 Tax=Cladophialophora psammophila CBS 110553 TaxID=1182543 RepID=W9X7E5_9EURO|nr:uncharacterized protein A1O5_03025 [Cladophialophora psammophila CBS 110553]EXJ73265.1 hypothetical protein A1O5_03025 [Cladophialophora psammophila CBS 110553]